RVLVAGAERRRGAFLDLVRRRQRLPQAAVVVDQAVAGDARPELPRLLHGGLDLVEERAGLHVMRRIVQLSGEDELAVALADLRFGDAGGLPELGAGLG